MARRRDGTHPLVDSSVLVILAVTVSCSALALVSGTSLDHATAPRATVAATEGMSGGSIRLPTTSHGPPTAEPVRALRGQTVPGVSAAPTYAPDPAEVGVSVRFSSGAAGGVQPYAYLWNLGSGPLSKDASPAFSYTAQGHYSGWVNVTDSDGAYANVTFTVEVEAGLVVGPIHSSSTSPTTATNVTFSVSVSKGVGSYTYLWQFGGSATSAQASPKYTFGSPGTYTVSVTVTDAAGGTSREELRLTVSKAPAPPLLTWLTTSPGVYLLLAVIVLGAVIVSVVLVARRRGGRQNGPAEDGGRPSSAELQLDRKD